MHDGLEKFELKEQLGRGAFSVVRRAIRRDTNEEVAIKIIDRVKAGDTEQKRLQTEIAILQKVKHPNIVSMRELIDSPRHLYLVMDLVKGGELFDKIVDKGQYTEKDASTIIIKMLDALNYLHSMGIAHRDLKPENLLLKDTDDTEVMISDFGLSKVVNYDSMMKTACGTPYYVAPEVLGATGYSKEVDLWSVGVIAYLLLCGFPPFYGDNLPEVFEQIMSADFEFPSPYWDNISNDAKDFISKLLVLDPMRRMSAPQAMNHSWVKNCTSTQSLKYDSAKFKLYDSFRRSRKSDLNLNEKMTTLKVDGDDDDEQQEDSKEEEEEREDEETQPEDGSSE